MLLIYVAHFSENREISLSDITNVTRTIGSEQLRSVIHDSYKVAKGNTMDYSGYASNLSDKTRMYIERNGDPEQKLNYALKAYSKGLLGEAPDELVGSDEKKGLYNHAYEDGQTVKQQRELGNKIDQAFERVMQGVKHEQV